MPKGNASFDGRDVPRPFTVMWWQKKRVWSVVQGQRRRCAPSLCIQVTVLSAGDELTGVGVVRCVKRGELVITA